MLLVIDTQDMFFLKRKCWSTLPVQQCEVESEEPPELNYKWYVKSQDENLQLSKRQT